MIVNGKSTKWRDAFVVRETDQNQLLLRNLQAKYDYDSVTFTNKNLIKEYIKNLESSYCTKLNKNDLHLLSRYYHITIIFTTQSYESTVSQENCLVIVSCNFEEFFGLVFASRAIFSLTKDINPNFSEPARMKNFLFGHC